MRTTASLLALIAVAACSNSSSSTQSATDVAGDGGAVVDATAELRDLIDADVTDNASTIAFAASLAEFDTDAAALDLGTINNTAFLDFPVTGSADYAGFVQVNAGPTANLGAEIDLTADFASGVITGEQTSAFFGAGADGLEEYAGEVTFSNGRAGARGITNNARLDIAGTITNDTNTVVVDAAIVGKFIGTPIVGLRGEVNVGDTIVDGAGEDVDAITLTLNGEAVTEGSAGFIAIAE